MRVLILTPSAPPAITGNAASVGRIARGLADRGIETTILEVGEGTEPSVVAKAVQDPGLDLVHVYHAWGAGRWIVDLEIPCPVVVTAPGTDVHEALLDPARGPTVERVLRLARRITSTNPGILETLASHDPSLRPRLRLVPKGLRPGRAAYDLRTRVGMKPGEILFLMVAGIRPAKDQIFPLAPLARLHAEGVPLRLVLAGPVIDAAYAERVCVQLGRLPWARLLEPIPVEAIGSALAGADVFINTSRHEGGSNALAEALHAGRAVLCSDIPGNRVLVEEGITGLLYASGSSEAFAEKARRLAAGPVLRRTLGEAAQSWARKHLLPGREAALMHAVYGEALADIAGSLPPATPGGAP